MLLAASKSHLRWGADSDSYDYDCVRNIRCERAQQANRYNNGHRHTCCKHQLTDKKPHRSRSYHSSELMASHRKTAITALHGLHIVNGECHGRSTHQLTDMRFANVYTM